MKIVLIEPQHRKSIFSMQKYANELAFGLAKDGINVSRYKAPSSKNVFISKLYKYVFYPIYFYFSNFDIYHVIDHSYGFLGALPRWKKKIIITCHDIIPIVQSQNYPTHSVNIFKYNILKMAKADCIISVSQYTRDCLKNFYMEPMRSK